MPRRATSHRPIQNSKIAAQLIQVKPRAQLREEEEEYKEWCRLTIYRHMKTRNFQDATHYRMSIVGIGEAECRNILLAGKYASTPRKRVKRVVIYIKDLSVFAF